MANKYQTLVVFFRGKGAASELKDDYVRNLRYSNWSYTVDGHSDLFKGGKWNELKGQRDIDHVVWRLGQLNEIASAKGLNAPKKPVGGDRATNQAWKEANLKWMAENVEIFGWISETPAPANLDAVNVGKPNADAKVFRSLNELKTLVGWTSERKRSSQLATKTFIGEDGKDAADSFLEMLKKDSK